MFRTLDGRLPAAEPRRRKSYPDGGGKRGADGRARMPVLYLRMTEGGYLTLSEGESSPSSSASSSASFSSSGSGGGGGSDKGGGGKGWDEKGGLVQHRFREGAGKKKEKGGDGDEEEEEEEKANEADVESG